MTARALLLIAVAALCAGCSLGGFCPGCDSITVVAPADNNYITFEHPFTDAAADDVRKRAESLCGQRRQVAEKTTSACSLTKCTTHYQCTSKAGAAGTR